MLGPAVALAQAPEAWHGGERPPLKAKDIDAQASELLLYAENYKNARRFGEAEVAAKDALKLLETRYGPADRRLVPALTTLGGIYFRQARHAEAEPYYRRASAIEEKSGGGGDPLELAKALQQQAKLLLNSGRAAEAVPLERRALAIYEKAYAGDDRMQTYYVIAANTEKYAGNYDEALRLLERAGVIAANHGAASRASVDLQISHVRFQQRRYDEAVVLLRGVIAAYEQKFGKDHPALAGPYNEMSNSLRALGRLQEADAAKARAIDLTELGRAKPALSP
jgi:tetratricopeptide (TPR) repeat protein